MHMSIYVQNMSVALAIPPLSWCRRGLHLHWRGGQNGEKVVVEDRRAGRHDEALQLGVVHGHLRKRGCTTP